VDALDIREQQAIIRKQALAQRNAQPERDQLSRQIVARLVALPEYQRAGTVLFYVDMRSEVQTQPYLPTALASGKRIVVPYCAPDGLQLFHLESLDELETGTFRILEPQPALRTLPHKRVAAESLDLVVVPGVAFDRGGARIGYGAGYFDKLLQGVRPDARLVALAFDCQMFPHIPLQAHDVLMDQVITEQAVYEGRRARA
jgi:5-formyltetrahydrofolate cyclo-ligase